MDEWRDLGLTPFEGAALTGSIAASFAIEVRDFGLNSGARKSFFLKYILKTGLLTQVRHHKIGFIAYFLLFEFSERLGFALYDGLLFFVLLPTD